MLKCNPHRCRTLGLCCAVAAVIAETPPAEADTSPPPQPPVVMTEQGAVQGVASEDHRAFLGIPYAAPPVGARRWRAPAPPASWSGIRDASAFGNRCPQFWSPVGNAPGESEDCLYLNVYTPAVVDHPLPVMVWLHGGTYLVGAGSDYDGSALAAHNPVIVVTLNYRLGPFGFLALKGLRNAAGSSGNYGLEDQQAALRWVRDNIAGFGGDPSNVTLFGESAGAASICDQMASPRAARLFDKAIMESAPCSTIFVSKPQRIAEDFGRGFAARPGLHCTGDDRAVARCMRGKTTQEILDVMTLPERYAVALTFLPVVDGVVLPEPPPAAFRSGHFNHVPVITGTNRNEGRLLVAVAADNMQPPVDLSDSNYVRGAIAVTEQTFPGLGRLTALAVPLALPFYPLHAYPAPAGYDPATAPAHLATSALMTDAVFACASSVANRQLERAGVAVYAYEFGDPELPNQIDSPYMPIAAGHTAELPFVFDTPLEGGTIDAAAQFDADQQNLSAQMQRYWTQFAATGDPNVNGSPEAAGLPYWPRYAARGGAQRLRLAPGAGAVQPVAGDDFDRQHQCGLWSPLMSGYTAMF